MHKVFFLVQFCLNPFSNWFTVYKQLKIDVKYNIVLEPRFHANQPVGQNFYLKLYKLGGGSQVGP